MMTMCIVVGVLILCMFGEAHSSRIEQIHIAIADNPDGNSSTTAMTLSYVTFDQPRDSFVFLGFNPKTLDQKHHAMWTVFTDGGVAASVRYMYVIPIQYLYRATTYYYQITFNNHKCCDDNVTDIFHFTTLNAQAGYTQPLRIAMFGDYGLANGQSHDLLDAMTEANEIDLVAHFGDIAYNLGNDNGTVGDDFMNREQSWATHTPWLFAPGNHEFAYNFDHYRYRYDNPNDPNKNFYYSINIGSVHLISLNAEAYFFPDNFDMDYIERQYNWLVADLAKANANRDKQNWVVVMAHRPIYCTLSTDDDEDCTINTYRIRDGVNWNGGQRKFGWERLFYESGVDAYLSGHEHSYERMFPVYRQQMLGKTYDPLIAPLYVVAGGAGCCGGLDVWDESTIYPYSASRSDSYGFGLLTVHNQTHALWQQIHDVDGAVFDTVWLVKPRSVVQ